jgi:nucleoid-associated protein YgaU
MMRKDVRIGFAIGGVFLAVLIVYGLITAGPQPTGDVTLAQGSGLPDAPAVNEAQPAAPASPTHTTGSGQGDPLASQLVPANTSAMPQTVQPTGSRPSVEDKWSRALSTGRLEPDQVPLLMTETPSLAAAQENAVVQPIPTAGPTAAPVSNSGDLQAGPTTPAAEAPAAPAGPSVLPNGGNGNFHNPDVPSTLSPSTQPALAGQRMHVVQPRETFSSIAAMVYGAESYYPHLLRANPQIDPKKLRPGMTIVIPDRSLVVADAGSPAHRAAGTSAAATAALVAIDDTREYRVLPSDSLHRISLKLYGKAERVEDIYQTNRELIGPDPSRLKAGIVLKLPEPPTISAAR